MGAFLENVGYTADRSPSPDVDDKQKMIIKNNVATTSSGSSGSHKEQLTNSVAENHIETSAEDTLSH